MVEEAEAEVEAEVVGEALTAWVEEEEDHRENSTSEDEAGTTTGAWGVPEATRPSLHSPSRPLSVVSSLAEVSNF